MGLSYVPYLREGSFDFASSYFYVILPLTARSATAARQSTQERAGGRAIEGSPKKSP
jgi:hypothetical protein